MCTTLAVGDLWSPPILDFHGHAMDLVMDFLAWIRRLVSQCECPASLDGPLVTIFRYLCCVGIGYIVIHFLHHTTEESSQHVNFDMEEFPTDRV